MTWPAVAALAVGTWLLKGVGPLTAGGRRLPPAVERLVGLLPPALLAALIVMQTLSSDGGVELDARVPAVALAGVAAWRGAPFAVVIVVGTLTAALLRLAGMP